MAATAANTVSGFVYENRSGGTRRAAGDPGIAGVLVSNGRDVVKTDAAGRYTLPIDEESIIFVIKPTGYAVPVDEQMLPRFYYIHQPAGSPQSLNLRYRGIDPTGALPDSVDFALKKADEPQKFDVLLFTDPQPESAAEVDFIRDDVVAGLIGNTCGRFRHDHRRHHVRRSVALPAARTASSGTSACPGTISAAITISISRRRTHAMPRDLQADLRPALLRVRIWQGAVPDARQCPLSRRRSRRGLAAGLYEGRIGERQLAFMANVLKETPPTNWSCIAMHIPLHNDLNPDDPRQHRRSRATSGASGRPPDTLSLSGHTHTTEHHYFGAGDGLPDRRRITITS